MITNYHTHIYRCTHATGDVEDYVKEAIRNNFDILGVSDHAPLPKYMFDRMHTDELEDYIRDVNECKEKYKGKIKILCGLEIEYFEDLDYYYHFLLEKVDYLVLGQHSFINDGNLKTSYRIHKEEHLKNYVEALKQGMATGYFSFIAHPDLFMFNYVTWDDLTEKYSRELITTAEKYKIPLEYNANGYRKDMTKTKYGEFRKYPRDEFWNIANKHNIDVLVNSDCHQVDYLYDDFYKKAYKDAQNLNLNIIFEINKSK